MAGHALIEKEGLYLVTRRSQKNDYMPGKWDLPGGEVKIGETVEQALTREVFEETGLSINIERLIYLYSNIDQVPKRQTFQAVYSCQYVYGEVKIDQKEHDDFQWCNWDKISSLDTIDFLTSLIRKAKETS